MKFLKIFTCVPIGLLGLGAIEKNGVNFNNIEKFRNLKPTGASTCLIMHPNNEIAPPETIQRLTESLNESGECVVILKPKNSTNEQFNFNRQFNIPEIWNRYTSFLLR